METFKILVTGGSGFIGKYLIPKLKDIGHRVCMFEEYSFKSISELPLNCDYLRVGDITDPFRVRTILDEIKPDIIIHLAAMTSVALSYDLPFQTMDTNFTGTMILAETARITCPNLRQFIYPSSAEVYGNIDSMLKKETDVCDKPNSPYSLSKLFTEYELNYLHRAFNFPITILRPFNTYGRIDSNFFVIEKTIVQMLTNKSVSGLEGICELGDSEPVRDFPYLDDHIRAYLSVIDNNAAIGETFNICSGIGIKIKYLVREIAERVGFNGVIQWGTMPKRPLDIMHLVGSPHKLTYVFDLPEPTSLGKGLDKTIMNWREKLGVG